MAEKEYALWLSGAPNDPPTRFQFFEETTVPVLNTGRWVEVARVTVAWDAPATASYDDNADPTLYTIETPAPSIRELKNQKRSELDNYAREVVAVQGVDGPQSKGADSVLGPRAYPTDTFGRNQVNGTLQAKDNRSGPMSDQTTFILQTLKRHPDRNGSETDYGDYVGLGVAPIQGASPGPYTPSTNNNSLYDLALALDTFDVALRNNLQALATTIENVAEPPTQTYEDAVLELDGIDITAGWPAPPVNP